MTKTSKQPDRRLAGAFSAPHLVILLTLAVLGGAIFSASQRFRHSVRQQIAGRDAQVLYTLSLKHSSSDTLANDIGPLGETEADLFGAIVEVSGFLPQSRALATRLFQTNGEFVASLPPDVSESRLSETELGRLHGLTPLSRFIPAARLPDLSPAESEEDKQNARPLLEVTVPLHWGDQARLLGIAQFVLEGDSIAKEFAELDRTLFAQAAIIFLASGSFVVAVLALGFRQLQKVNQLLSERTKNLLRANQELTWAAKASAIGAVTSHLIHGLRNPLSGLQNFMASRGPQSTGSTDTEWRLAVTTARRMQTLVSEVVRILREESDPTRYEITLEEIVQIIASKTNLLAQHAGVAFQTKLGTEGILNNRDANLIILVLENLVQNGIQATPRGKAVTLRIEAHEDQIVCRVEDQGPGMGEFNKKDLFQPCQSTKEHGSGIGLAISKQLANSIGAELELESTGSDGCVFSLAIPEKLLVTKSGDSEQPMERVQHG